MVLLVIALGLLSDRGILAQSPNNSDGGISVDDATRQCQDSCVNTPLLYECDEWCTFKYPDEHNLDTCLRYCTRNILICLKGCANLENRRKLQELREKLGLPTK